MAAITHYNVPGRCKLSSSNILLTLLLVVEQSSHYGVVRRLWASTSFGMG